VKLNSPYVTQQIRSRSYAEIVVSWGEFMLGVGNAVITVVSILRLREIMVGVGVRDWEASVGW